MTEPLPYIPPAASVPAPIVSVEEDDADPRVSRPDDGIPSFDGEESADVESQIGEATFNPEVADFQAEH